MTSVLPALPPEAETIAELRALYRSAEARAARLRLLSTLGQELTLANADTLDATLARCARSLAFFLGSTCATLLRDPAAPGIAVHAPGSGQGTGAVVATLRVDGHGSLDTIADEEDRATCRLCLDLFGATIERVQREGERAGLLATLREREARLEMLVGRIFSAQEEERRRVSGELHDGVAQTATALVRLLEGSGEPGAAGGGGLGGEGGIRADERARLAAIARDLLRELRAVIAGLRPTLLDDLGLVAALQALGDSLAAEGYTVAAHLGSAPVRLAPHLETALFRVAQEAVNNIRKHAGGPCAVRIELSFDAGTPRLHICDAGRGVQPGEPGSRTVAGASPASDGDHVGIPVMHERMAAIGGVLHWQAGPNGGVSVTATVPPTPAPLVGEISAP